MTFRVIAAALMLALGVTGCASTTVRPADITQVGVVDAAQLIREKKIDLTPIITHRFRLDDYKEAFRLNHEQGTSGAVKVLFEF